MTRPVVILPDLHGRLDLLEGALEYAGREWGPQVHFLSLGDAIDRGPQSVACAGTLLDLARAGRATLLMGNHERMAQEGLQWYRAYLTSQDPADYRRALEGFRWWIGNGGESVRREVGALTLETFPTGLAEYLDTLTRVVYVTGDGEVHRAVPAEPSVLVAHASPPVQHRQYPSPESAALWLRPFEGPFPLPPGVTYSVHGHTPVRAPTRLARHVYLDLGAYETGRVALLTVRGPEDVAAPPPVTVLEGRGDPAAARRYPTFGEALPVGLAARTGGHP
ncbi:serine/threonine protein phosphatase 1 [Deinococcus sp. HSC-46F16]|uniref:metallophosphoesterase n=1 Tax=Deinococcus sp. HSC-46F16 TaxID=2910968 RepID=UPI0020A1385D|nr:metallophosphoesterase [Deinococcus sp. HSC-46F16]MCP2014262.1 serine/threonine protein phosphatase 1 [Deinococcus sp. HSC-46F16]